MPTHETSIDSPESIRHAPPPKSSANGLSAAPTRDFMDGVPWRQRMEQHPAYQMLASTLPIAKIIEAVREGLQVSGNRLIGQIEAIPEGRYFAIQKITDPQ